jgi:type IV secretory pathway VirB10-like protein
LRDHSHIPLEDSDVCAHCGQALPGRKVVTYGQKGANRTGLIVTIALHLLLVAVWLFQPKAERHAPPKAGQAVVWLPPLKPNKPTPQAEQPAPKQSATTLPPMPKLTQPRIVVPRLPDTITLPNEKPVEQPKPQPKEETKLQPDETDMAAFIEKRRQARGARSEQPAEESDAQRGMRNAMANIAAINGRGGQDPNETGGVFSVTNKTFSRADLKFRGWNPNFKRRWLTAVTVERGSDPDIETAIVRKMIELIRKEKTGDFEWDSHRLNKVVTLSARPADTKELTDFLYKEMFPDYKPPR